MGHPKLQPPSRAYLDSLKTAYEVIYGIQMGETLSQQESQEAEIKGL